MNKIKYLWYNLIFGSKGAIEMRFSEETIHDQICLILNTTVK